MAYTRTWNSSYEADPADSSNASAGASKIRNLKVDIRERLSKDHYFDTSGTDADHGEHSKVTLRVQSSKPTAASNKGYLYTKLDGSVVRLYFEDSDGNEVVLSGAPIGFLTSPDVVYSSSSEVSISPFSIEINGNLYYLNSTLAKSVSSLSASTWYYLFAQAPSSGNVLSGSEISYSSTAPSFSTSKLGWYDAGGTKRCFGVFYSNATSNVAMFLQSNGWVYLDEPIKFVNNPNPMPTSWTAVSVGAPALGALTVGVMGYSINKASTSPNTECKGSLRSYNSNASDDSSTLGLDLYHGADTVPYYFPASGGAVAFRRTNSSQQVEYKVSNECAFRMNKYWYGLLLFKLPKGF